MGSSWEAQKGQEGQRNRGNMIGPQLICAELPHLLIHLNLSSEVLSITEVILVYD
jgi:hypothetical protein